MKRAKEALEGASALMLQLEVPVEVSLAVARAAASQGVAVVLDPGPARPLPEELYAYCAFITPNETEGPSAGVLPRRGPDLGSACGGGAGGARSRVCSDQDGCWGGLLRYQRPWAPPARLPGGAVDSVAEGDAFNGALTVGVAEGKPLEEAVRWGMAAGALAVTKTGAQDSMPSREEVENFLADR